MNAESVSQHVGDADVEALLRRILETLSTDESLTDEEREDSAADVAAIRGELTRRQPRKEILRSYLSTLGDIASLSGLVAQLGGLILG